MLDEMVWEDPPTKIGLGCCMPNKGMWLEGPTESPFDDSLINRETNMYKLHFHWKSKCTNEEIVPNVGI
jgi:hypothetical protein